MSICLRRRDFITLLGGAAAAWPLAARAQQSDWMQADQLLMATAEDSDGRSRIAVFQRALNEWGGFRCVT